MATLFLEALRVLARPILAKISDFHHVLQNNNNNNNNNNNK